MPNYQHMHFATVGREIEPPLPPHHGFKISAPPLAEAAEVPAGDPAMQPPPAPETAPPTILGVPVATPTDPDAPPSI